MRNVQAALEGEPENAAQGRSRREKAETEVAVVIRDKDELLQVMAQAKK